MLLLEEVLDTINSIAEVFHCWLSASGINRLTCHNM